MTLAYALTGDYYIYYELRHDIGQIKLRLWEPPGPSSKRPTANLPYLYAVNFTFNTLREAEVFLHEYLMNNGALDAPDRNFPDEGRIEILPFPTWGLN